MDGDQGVVFVGIGCWVVALDATTGTVLWSRRLKATTAFTTVSIEGGALVAATGGEVFRLDLGTGEVLWHNKLKGFGTGLVTFASGRDASAAAAQFARRQGAAAASATSV
ncbi:MAG: PQQ-binding-like beta-propeller repeat protein [Acidobacteriota bacterium]